MAAGSCGRLALVLPAVRRKQCLNGKEVGFVIPDQGPGDDPKAKDSPSGQRESRIMSAGNLRDTLLAIIDGLTQEHDSMQAASVLQRAARTLGPQDLESQRAVLASFYDLFRTGYLSGGHNLANPSPPWCHVTALGRRALAQKSRDPANPNEYLVHLRSAAQLNLVTDSYIVEALNAFNNACFKATAMMVGAAAESVVLSVRDGLVARVQALGRSVPPDLSDWRIKRIVSAIEATITTEKTAIPATLWERFQANWPAVTQQIRTARNEAGHPVTVEPVTAEEVHASLLLFPELAVLAAELEQWIGSHFA